MYFYVSNSTVVLKQYSLKLILRDIILQYTYLLNAIPLGTCEKAKACKYRESETWN